MFPEEKNMRKTSVLFVVLLVVVSALSAVTDNRQKIFPVGSEEYKTIKYLYIAQGHSLPSTTGPWSADELSRMLDVLDYDSLDQVQKSMYDAVAASVKARPAIDLDKVGLNFTGSVSLELYFHTNTDGYERETRALHRDSDTGAYVNITEKAFQGNHWIYNEYKHKSFANFELETYLTDHFYADFQADIANSWHSDGTYSEELGVSKLSTNILGLKNLKFNLGYFDGNWPYRAFLSIGGENWNIQIGRDRISWGPGETGNLTISDNMPWQNFGRITAYSNYLKYTFLTSFYPHPINYWANQGGADPHWDALDKGYGTPVKGLSMYIGHRLEGRLLKDKLTLAATEGLMYMSEDNTIDLRALNPLNFNHNNYIASNSNSTLTLEFNYTPIRMLNIYGQMIVDEIAFPGIETPPSEEYNTVPTAMGFLLGVSGSFTLGNGLFHANAEFAKTDPYLYLRDGIRSGKGNYGINYVVAIRNWTSVGAGITFDEYILGYTYGPDAIVANAKAGWTTADMKLSIEGSFFYMAHGTHDAWTTWKRIGGNPDYEYDKASPTTKHTSYNEKYTDYESRNSVEKTMVFGVNASYKILPGLTAMAQVDYVDIRNFGNIEGVDQKDIQLVVGATYSF